MTVDDVAASYDIGRASIYAALSGRRLPSRTTLTAMVESWAPDSGSDLGRWMRRRAEVEQSLAPVLQNIDRLQEVRQVDADPSQESMDAQLALARRLVELVEMSGANRKQIASQTRYSASTLSAALSGRTLPSREFLDQLMMMLGIEGEEARNLLELRQKALVGRRRPWS